MKFKIKIYVFTMFVCYQIYCQNDNKFYDLRYNCNLDSIMPIINKQLTVHEYPIESLNYTNLLLKTWKEIQLGNFDVKNEINSQSLCFVGDNKNIIRLSEKIIPKFEQLDDTSYLNLKRKKMQTELLNPKAIIIKALQENQIIMINEAHDRAQTRSFLLSLLKDMKNAGAECLALEALDEKGNLYQLDIGTGIYAAEPLMGQIIREALGLGYKLIPYEMADNYEINHKIDYTSSNYYDNMRDSVQACNLYSKIKKGNGISKTVVLGGYGHISEANSYMSNFRSMAMHFKRISKINPITIDQTILIEANINHPYIKQLFDKVTNNDTVRIIKFSEISKFIQIDSINDLFVYHPNTKYTHNRPEWLIATKEFTFIPIKLPKDLKPVLVQAYLLEEISSEIDFKIKIPWDQTFLTENNKVWLVLKKEKNYVIVYRDWKNRIICKKKIKT